MAAQPISQPRAAIYCRVSRDKQEDGYSLDEQEAGCRHYAEERGYQIAGIYREVYDGEELNRPQLDALREAGKRGEVDTLIVYVQDRLARGSDAVAVTFYLLDAAGITPECVLEPYESGALGAGMRAIRGMVSGMEKEAITRRTQGGRRARAKSGKLLPSKRPLYGYRWKDAGTGKGQTKVAYEIDEATAPIVRRIFAELVAGTPLRALAARLQDEGIPAPGGGGMWHYSTVRRLAQHPGYIGEACAYSSPKLVRVTENGARVWRHIERPDAERVALPEGTIPPLVSRELYEAVAQRLAQNKAQATRNNRDPEAFLLRAGYVVCGACGRPAVTMWRTGKTPSSPRLPVYQVKPTRWQHIGCPCLMYSARKLDAEVWAGLARRMQDRGFIARQIAAHEREDTTAGELAAVDHALADVERRQRNTARAVALVDDPDASAPLVAELAALAKQRQALDARRQGLLAQRAAWEERGRLLADLDAWCETWRGNLDTADYALKRKILAALALTVELYPASHRPPYVVRTDWSAALVGGDGEAIVSRSSWITTPPTGTR